MQKISPDTSSKKIIAEYSRLLKTSIAAPDISAPSLSTEIPARDEKRPLALILSPHPDDECLMGALPLRLRREKNWQIINIAVTLGSNPARQAERKKELAKACAFLGFTCVLLEEKGFSDVSAAKRGAAAAAWSKKVEKIVKIIARLQPQAIFMPHAKDRHATHVGAHLLGMDALATMPKDFTCAVALTEYWGQLAAPNAAVGINENDAAILLSALACHVGEGARNAYDRRFPAFLIDAVRRRETLGAFGKAVSPMNFAQLLSVGVWTKGRFVPSALSRTFGEAESIAPIFG